ncbi:MAG: GntR family transcriptional regulator [Thermotogae bacterium]|uniref:GntR family transcriptional regulator n=1 Tax=Kosmotoga sp. TaxID=1955248 RepID=UPI000F21C78F|nr:GntR family transcriptional regulator [Kosmotoga sp.]MBO8166522.1 GntR family transcriptional regulator [Kosmotoga sp.]MCD6160172.1 GntR family transcriptional regulator [Kosmotoga sp.]RKX49893.1 MAG: GntR family transcriptional regulator [Thermotogota bacterium]
MLVNLDIHSPMPIYKQIKQGIVGKILRGELKRDDALPSIRELATALRVNPNTVVRAYKELELEGILIARQGIGFLISTEAATIKEVFLMSMKRELSEVVIKAKKSGIMLEELQKVVEELWKGMK